MPKILEKNRGMLKVHAATATLENEEELDLAYSLNGAPVVSFEDGTTIYFTWDELIQQALELKDSEGDEIK